MSENNTEEIAKQIESSLRLLFDDGDVFETRLLDVHGGGRPHTASGYWGDIRKCAAELAHIDTIRAPSGIYVTLNPVNKTLLARANNVLIAYAKHATSDQDILKRRNFLIDIDPIRPAGISSSQEELDKAAAVANQVLSYLTSEGWPTPIRALSSNGIHLLYRIDLPNDQVSSDLLRQILEGLKNKFSPIESGVAIDSAVWNPARITKVYGTVSRKGQSIPDRPHRRSKLLDAPETITCVPADVMRTTVEKLRTQVPPSQVPNNTHQHVDPNTRSKLLVDRWLADRGVEFTKKDKPSADGRTVWVLKTCPFDSSHGNTGEVCIMQDPSGKMSAQCMHNSCTAGWQEFKKTIGPPRADHYDPPLKPKKRDKSSLPPGVFPLSDLGNANRFLARHGKKALYNHSRETWMYWDGSAWKAGGEYKIEMMAHETVRAISQEVRIATTQEQRDLITSWALQSESGGHLREIPRTARGMLEVEQSHFDDKPWLLNVANGTIDLRTGQIRAHNREDYLTSISPTVYDPTAECPTWLNFLSDIFCDDLETITYIQRMVGYSLTGVVSEHVLPVLYGTGSNGKSTFVNTIMALLGEDYSMKATSTLLMETQYEPHPTEKADVHGKRFVVAVETGEGKRLNETTIKELTGDDKIRARKMRQDFFEFPPTHKTWLTTNHRPVVRGSDHGIWRRLKLVPFLVCIPDGDQDHELKYKLFKELPGILNWAIAGCLAWQQHGIGSSESVSRATEEYKTEMDTIGQFLEDECLLDSKYSCLASDLYDAYRHWCVRVGCKALSQARFGTSLAERGHPKHKEGSVRRRLGIKLIMWNSESTLNRQPQQGIFDDLS
jgi:P4 family phage/plasmid primase-like protien